MKYETLFFVCLFSLSCFYNVSHVIWLELYFPSNNQPPLCFFLFESFLIFCFNLTGCLLTATAFTSNSLNGFLTLTQNRCVCVSVCVWVCVWVHLSLPPRLTQITASLSHQSARFLSIQLLLKKLHAYTHDKLAHTCTYSFPHSVQGNDPW